MLGEVRALQTFILWGNGFSLSSLFLRYLLIHTMGGPDCLVKTLKLAFFFKPPWVSGDVDDNREDRRALFENQKTVSNTETIKRA